MTAFATSVLGWYGYLSLLPTMLLLSLLSMLLHPMFWKVAHRWTELLALHHELLELLSLENSLSLLHVLELYLLTIHDSFVLVLLLGESELGIQSLIVPLLYLVPQCMISAPLLG